MDEKIKSIQSLANIVSRLRQEKKIIVTTNGCFDILHLGHIKNLEWAKKQGDVLIVGINSDRSVRKIKGLERPIISDTDRARILAALAIVDYVLIFGSKNPIPWLQKIKPHIHVKGEQTQYEPSLLPEKEIVEKNGGRIMFAPMIKGKSTTDIIKKIIARHSRKKVNNHTVLLTI